MNLVGIAVIDHFNVSGKIVEIGSQKGRGDQSFHLFEIFDYYG